MEHIGHSLVNKNGEEVWYIGETKGQLMTLPSRIVLPKGDQVHGAKTGDKIGGDLLLVERWISDVPPSIWHASVGWSVSFDGEKIIVTVLYEDVASIVPQTVTPRQARLGLLSMGLLDQVGVAVEQAGSAAKITWEYATTIDRTDALVNDLGAALGLTTEQIDDLFRQASVI